MQEEYQLLLLRKDWHFLHSMPGITTTTSAPATNATSATAPASITAEGLPIKGNEKYEDVKNFIK